VLSLKLWQNRLYTQQQIARIRAIKAAIDAEGQPIPTAARPSVGPPPLWSEGEKLRQTVRQSGPWTWVALLVMAGMTDDRRRARRVAHLLLGIAVLIALAVLATPNVLPRRASDDQLLWLIGATLMLGVSAFVLRHAMTGRRTEMGRCETCGYNLRGNISGICPECGTPVALAPA
jgi:hypothetical protein